MGGGSPDGPALAEVIVFLCYFNGLQGPQRAGAPGRRCARSTRCCSFALLAVLAGAETITDIARFGGKTLALPGQFRPFAAGTSAQDTWATSATLDAEAFQRCSVAWVAALIGVPEGGGSH
jgi:hypothetical protein